MFESCIVNMYNPQLGGVGTESVHLKRRVSAAAVSNSFVVCCVQPHRLTVLSYDELTDTSYNIDLKRSCGQVCFWNNMLAPHVSDVIDAIQLQSLKRWFHKFSRNRYSSLD